MNNIQLDVPILAAIEIVRMKELYMDKLINETAEIARKHFQGFGFEDEQILPLLEAGKRDLTKELNKLQKLLDSEVIEVDEINLSFHALKGLLLNMGNSAIADKLVELRRDNVNADIIAEIKSLIEE